MQWTMPSMALRDDMIVKACQLTVQNLQSNIDRPNFPPLLVSPVDPQQHDVYSSTLLRPQIYVCDS